MINDPPARVQLLADYSAFNLHVSKLLTSYISQNTGQQLVQVQQEWIVSGQDAFRLKLLGRN